MILDEEQAAIVMSNSTRKLVRVVASGAMADHHSDLWCLREPRLRKGLKISPRVPPLIREILPEGRHALSLLQVLPRPLESQVRGRRSMTRLLAFSRE